MRIIQFLSPNSETSIGIVQNDTIKLLNQAKSTYELVKLSWKNKCSLDDLISELASDETISYRKIFDEGKILPPLTHPDPYHTWVTGTGLTHLGSASSRSEMHNKSDSELTDSMKMFKMGVKDGCMQNGKPGVQPEWFYKGNGLSVVAAGQPIPSPSFALDGGEEPEIAGLYMINDNREPQRIGFALGNEFSDHQMEKMNYLYLAHSKLRKCSYGPELLIGELPREVVGKSKILREGNVVWEKAFLTGENNMSHNLANLEYHHFKYDLFRQPGDVHVHFFGTSVLSFADRIEIKKGDVFDISADCFTHPLINSLA